MSNCGPKPSFLYSEPGLKWQIAMLRRTCRGRTPFLQQFVSMAFSVAFAAEQTIIVNSIRGFSRFLPQVFAPGTLGAWGSSMTIAIPVLKGRISPVLDMAARLLVVRRRRGEGSRKKRIGLKSAVSRCACPQPGGTARGRVALRRVI